MKLRSMLVLSILALSFGGPTLAAAQAIQPPVDSSAATYSDSELRSFAAAVVEVQRLTDVYVPQLRSAATPEERNLVHNEAAVQMTRAVEKEGLSPERFHEILMQARVDAGFAERIRKHIIQPD